MPKRQKLSRNGSEAYFTATASKTHIKNAAPPAHPMRGGIRL